jgi:hypothetical protein
MYRHATGCNTIPNCEDVASAASDPAQPDAAEIEEKRPANPWLHATGWQPTRPARGRTRRSESVEPKANYEAKPIFSFVFIKLSRRKPNSVSRGEVYQACNRMQHDPQIAGCCISRLSQKKAQSMYRHATGCNTIPNCEDVASAAPDPAQPDAAVIEEKAPRGGAHAGVKSVEPKANYEAKPISPFVFIKLSKRKPNSVSRGRSGIRESRPRCPDVDAGFAKTDSEVGRAMPTEG